MNLKQIRNWISKKYHALRWRNVPKWKRQTHVLRRQRGVAGFIGWLFRRTQ